MWKRGERGAMRGGDVVGRRGGAGTVVMRIGEGEEWRDVEGGLRGTCGGEGGGEEREQC